MADIPAGNIRVITIAGGAGQPVIVETFTGTPPNQTLVGQFQLTGAQNTAIVAAFTAAASTTTDTQVPAGPALASGMYNAV